MAKTKQHKKDVDSYTIRGTNEVVRVGDCVLMRASDSENKPYVARVEKMEADGRGSVRVRVRWYCKCDMPCNPNVLMVQCDICKTCLNLKDRGGNNSSAEDMCFFCDKSTLAVAEVVVYSAVEQVVAEPRNSMPLSVGKRTAVVMTCQCGSLVRCASVDSWPTVPFVADFKSLSDVDLLLEPYMNMDVAYCWCLDGNFSLWGSLPCVA
ncbi:hypothetical protein PR202_ga20998 [Eleusine coracana subsp. coracana]|uniref:BAH domain-containing protein n=1 Tax=Eleusine coracana subsp. coracana TaxID=191504 RepID=A0AAV5CZP8_ELECO|nr:hypothetical protein PR202_ga20998 [Eleusine coracana subsp. coracana]